MPSFADIANKKAATIEKPPLPPVGNYVMMIIENPQVQKRSSDKGEFEIVDISLQGVQALDDVDKAELKKFGGAKGVRVRKSFIFNTAPDGEAAFQRETWNLRSFLVDHLKLDANKSLMELLGMCKGCQCQVEVGLRPDTRNPENFFADVKSTMPLS